MESSAVSLVGGAGASAPAPAPRAVPSGQSAPPSGPPQPAPAPDLKFLASQVIGQAKEAGDISRDTYARFVVDPQTHDVHVEIVDANKQQVIRSIPGDDLRRMAQEYRASQGFVVDSAI